MLHEIVFGGLVHAENGPNTVEAFHGPIAQKAIKSELGTIPVFVLTAIENIGYVANYRITNQSVLKTAI